MNVRVCVGVCGGGKGLSHPVRRVKEGLPRAMQSLQLSLGQPVLCLGGPGHLVEGWSLPHRKKQGSLGLGGGSTAILAFPSCHCGDPEKQGPVKVVHPLLAITPCPTTFGFIGIAFLSRVGFTALLPWSGTSHQPWEGLTPSLPPTPPFL